MDSLGGILIKGLLGNPILARFSLFLNFTIEDITPTPSVTQTLTPTPSVTSSVEPTPAVSATAPTPTVSGTEPTPTVSGTEPTPTVSGTEPTPTPTINVTVPAPDLGGGGGGGGTFPVDEKRTIRITISYKDKHYSSVHTITDKMLRVTINTISRLNAVKQKFMDISVKFKKKEQITVKVKRNDD